MALSELGTLGLVACAGVACVRTLLFVLRRRGESDTATPRRPAPPPPDDPRWQPSTGEPQIVGKACAHCATSFVTARDGRACKVCGVLVHRKPCHGEHKRAAHLGGNDPYR